MHTIILIKKKEISQTTFLFVNNIKYIFVVNYFMFLVNILPKKKIYI